MYDEHRAALAYDLMTRTCYTIWDVGGALDWASLRFFVYGLLRDQSSMIWRELCDEDGDYLPWIDGSKTAPILADIFDLLSWFQHTYVQANSKKKVKKPKPYPRPWVKESGGKRIGKDAIPASDFQAWWDAQSSE